MESIKYLVNGVMHEEQVSEEDLEAASEYYDKLVDKQIFNADKLGVDRATYRLLADKYGYEISGDWNRNREFKKGNTFIWCSRTFWVKAELEPADDNTKWFRNHRHFTNLIDAMEGK